jgi:hypothetical protein
MRLLALDPGNSTGWAFFVDGVLMACGACKGPSKLFVPDVDHVVIENPQVYPRSKVNPNDLMTLARMVGRYEERFAHIPTKLVAPREWKGTIVKTVMLKRIKAAMTPGELALLGNCPHDTVDAVGLGRWALRFFPAW